MLKTRKQVRDEFARRGLTWSDWARKRSYNPSLVSSIVNDNDKNPARKCLRGESHNIAVELGLKAGEISRHDVKQREGHHVLPQ